MAQSLGRAYARALFEMASAEGAVVAVHGDMLRVRDLVKTTPDLAVFLKDREIDAEGKRKAFVELFEDRLHPLVLDWLCTLAGQGRAPLLGEAAAEYLEISAAGLGEEAVGEARSAFPMSDGQRESLEEAVSGILNQRVQLTTRVDPSLLGGVRVQVGSRVIDGSVRRRLDTVCDGLVG